MTKVKFILDIERDLFNAWETANFETTWTTYFKDTINPKILEICEGKKYEESKEKLKKYYSRMHSNKIVNSLPQIYQDSWDKINDEYFEILERITGKKMPFDEIKAYLTTQSRCPYSPNEPSFMVSIFNPVLSALKTCGHELMHIHFHNTYWEDIERQIGKEKTGDLKEALTVLLNIEFRHLWMVTDKGYGPHKELRKFIVDIWTKEKNFEKLLEECVIYLKD